jgi:ParB-like chromosome segregation protein Spo0J
MTTKTHHFDNKPFRRIDVPLRDITIRDSHRAVNQDKVNGLAGALRDKGLLYKIIISDRLGSESRVLIAGRHRLEAARQLGWLTIPAYVITPASEIEESMIEISENLDRAELTPEEASLQRAEYARLRAVKRGELAPDAPVAKIVQPRVQGQASTTGGISEAARETGVSRQQLQRDIAIASIPQEVRDEARAAGLTTQSALLEVAAEVAATAPEKARRAKASKAPKAKAEREVSQAQAEGLLDGDERDELFADRAAPLHDKIAAAVKFCLPSSEWKAALDAIGIADPNVKSPDLGDVWVTSSDDERVAFLDSIQIAPDHRPWHYRPHIIALDAEADDEPTPPETPVVEVVAEPILDRKAPWMTNLDAVVAETKAKTAGALDIKALTAGLLRPAA